MIWVKRFHSINHRFNLQPPGACDTTPMRHPALHHNELTGKLVCYVLSWQLIAASCWGSGNKGLFEKRWSVDWRSCPPSLNGMCFTWNVASVYSAASFSRTWPRGAQHTVTPAHLWFVSGESNELRELRTGQSVHEWGEGGADHFMRSESWEVCFTILWASWFLPWHFCSYFIT